MKKFLIRVHVEAAPPADLLLPGLLQVRRDEDNIQSVGAESCKVWYARSRTQKESPRADTQTLKAILGDLTLMASYY